MGSVVGALLLGLVETAAVYLAASDIRVIASYTVLALILILRPSGLLGR
jgi:branched-subunit amino acid ABC-type transport system permease component